MARDGNQVNPLLLYLFLLKATLTSFSGLASLPVVRQDLVVKRGVLTDRQIGEAVAAGARRWTEMACGSSASVTSPMDSGRDRGTSPSLRRVPRSAAGSFAGARARTPRVRTRPRMMLASAGLLISSSVALARTV